MRQTDRRRFLVSTVSVAAPMILSERVLGRNGTVSAGDRVTLAGIGFGPRGRYVLAEMLALPEVQCVAVCDVQLDRREGAREMVNRYYGNRDCVAVRDFRDLLSRHDIDAVLVATGDRWHALASIMSAEAGKDVYSEKPCGLTMEWCRRLADCFDRTGRIFQAGTQRRNIGNFQQAVQLAQSGKLGRIHTLFASAYQPEVKTAWLPGEPRPPEEVVDWDLWLGPAPWRPFNARYVQGDWRGYWDFDSGCRLLDWGAHTVDLCQWAIGADETTPIEYRPEADQVTAVYPSGVKLVIDFLATPFGERPGWIQDLGTCPVRFVGEEGWVETGDSGGIEVYPATLKKELPPPPTPVGGLQVKAHAADFFKSVRSRRRPAAHQGVMQTGHIACHAAALAWLLQRPLRLNPADGSFLDDPEANALRSRPSREPWTWKTQRA